MYGLAHGAQVLVSSNCFPTNKCGETLYTFRRPDRGWAGTIPTESSARIVRQPLELSALALAIEGQTIATGGHGAIDILRQTIRTARYRT